jgi:hypothetical protein
VTLDGKRDLQKALGRKVVPRRGPKGGTVENAKVPLLLSAVLFAYLLPAAIARARRHREVVLITLLNLLLGWTGLGWAVAFAWSWSENVRPV